MTEMVYLFESMREETGKLAEAIGRDCRENNRDFPKTKKVLEEAGSDHDPLLTVAVVMMFLDDSEFVEMIGLPARGVLENYLSDNESSVALLNSYQNLPPETLKFPPFSFFC